MEEHENPVSVQTPTIRNQKGTMLKTKGTMFLRLCSSWSSVKVEEARESVVRLVKFIKMAGVETWTADRTKSKERQMCITDMRNCADAEKQCKERAS